MTVSQRRSLVLLALLAGAAGCRVGPKYVRPTVSAFTAPDLAGADTTVVHSPLPYKEADGLWAPAAPADGALRGAWWTLFNDPELSLLEVKAGIQNQALQSYAARFAAARAQIGIDNASRFPTLGVAPSVSGLRQSTSRPYFNAAGAVGGLADLQLPLTFNYEIDLFGRIRRTIDLDREEAQAVAADQANVQLSIQSELAMDFFELRSADAEARLLADTVTQYREALRITRNRFEGGVVAESDVFQAKTQLQAALVQLADIGVARAQYEHAIAVLIGQPPNSFALPVRPLATKPPLLPASLPSALLERRPDIAAAERRTAEANERIGIARAAYFPTLSFSAAFGYEAASLTSLFNASNIVYALGPTLGQTFFDAGRRRNVSAQAFAGFEQTSADYRQTTLTAFSEVEDNLAALRILRDEAEQQRQATAAAQGAEQIFNNRYVGGIDTYLQVVTAQNTALGNERNDIDILRRRMDASVLLIKALGGGWSTVQIAHP